jgi:hypothetical protein
MKYYVDYYCEIDVAFGPYITEKFYDFSKLTLEKDAVYIVGRTQLRHNAEDIRDLVNAGYRIVFSNPAEGSETFVQHLRMYGVEDLVLDGKLPVITGGDLPCNYPHMVYEHFLTQPLRYTENLAAQARTPEIFTTHPKPYKYLFLNGRYRPQRRALINSLEEQGLLEHALWTCLDGQDRPVRLLPEHYEVEQFQANMHTATGTGFVKNQLFNNLWGEIYIKPEPYIDTYFSLVTETVFNYPYSFRTEKTAKPITMGHPFIVAANRGFYRDLRNLGFQTFGHIIDESFDSVDSDQDRLERIVAVVKDLCSQDLEQFSTAAASVCKYNQQHLQLLHNTCVAEFPDRFFKFLNTHE